MHEALQIGPHHALSKGEGSVKVLSFGEDLGEA
jgi:hypothetical protein